MKCVNCNQELPNGASFCMNCGTKQPVAPQQPAPPQQPPVQQVPQQPQYTQAPKQPQQPQQAQVPQQPTVQQVPQQPQYTQVPKQPQQPQQAQMPQKAQMPQQPQQPQYAQVPQQPQYAQVPQQPQYAQVPQQPQAPKKSNKGLFIGLGVAAALAIILAGVWWFFLRGGSGSDLEKMIPGNATAVARLDASRMAESIGLEINGNQIKLPKRVEALLGSDVNEMNETFTKLKDSGINLLGSVYGFMTTESLTGALLIPLTDEGKAQKFLEQEAHLSFSKMDKGQFCTQDESLFMIKNNALLIGVMKDPAMSGAIVKMAGELMDGKQDNISSHSEITDKIRADKALCIYVNNEKIHGLLEDVPGYRSSIQNNPLSFLMDDFKTTNLDIDVDDNKLSLNTDISTKGNDYEDFMKTIFHTAGDDFLKYMPAGCNAIVAAGVSGKKITSMSQISSILGSLPPDVKSQIEAINGTIAAGAVVDPKNPSNINISYTILIGTDDPNGLLNLIKGSLYSPDMGNIGVVGNYLYISSNSQVTAGQASLPGECKQLFKDNWLAAYTSLGVSSFEFNTNLGISSAKNLNGTFYINENGKKMKPIEWPVAFAETKGAFSPF